MRAVLVRRTGDGLSSPLQHALAPGYQDVPVIGSLAELPALLLSGAEALTAVPVSNLRGRSPADMPARTLGGGPGRRRRRGPE